MALPLPRVVPDVGPGGGLATAMGGMNSLANSLHQTRMNKVKADYAPLTVPAQAYSQLAYANAVSPQILAKIMTDTGALSNLSEDQKKNVLDTIYKAGIGQNNGFNMLNNMPQPTGIGNSSTNNFLGFLKNGLKEFLGPRAPQPFQEDMPPASTPQELEANSSPVPRPKDGVTLEGQQWYNAKGEPVYEEEQMPKDAMKLELTKGIKPKTYAENEGEYKGTVKQLEQEGKYRADALHAIGQSQLGLSHSGAVLDRMTGIITNPVFANMRNRIPGFQNKQLDYLKVMGTPEEKELIGDFLSTGESFIASTVQGFSGKPLVREFDLAQRQKITPYDTVESATGKLQSASALHDIAEKKNQIISELLQKGYNEVDAVKYANKMVDVSAIEKATRERLQRKIAIKNNKTGVTKEVTIEEARKLGVPNV